MQEEFEAGPSRIKAAAKLKINAVCFEDIIDPDILSCNHSVCWQRLANCAVQGLNSCKEQSLEPVNLKIEFEADKHLLPAVPDPDLTAFTSPPGTPRAWSPPEEPPPAPCPAADPPLLKALKSRSIHQVRRILEKDAEAAKSVFMEHRFEPPLCACIELECGVEITRLLLEKGAEVDWQDCDGYTPLALLSKKPYGYQPTAFDFEKFHVTMNSQEQDAMRVAEVLLAAGANPSELAPGGVNCVQLAQAAGNTQLASLLLGDRHPESAGRSQAFPQVWNTRDILAAELPLLYEPTAQIAALGAAADMLERALLQCGK